GRHPGQGCDMIAKVAEFGPREAAKSARPAALHKRLNDGAGFSNAPWGVDPRLVNDDDDRRDTNPHRQRGWARKSAAGPGGQRAASEAQVLKEIAQPGKGPGVAGFLARQRHVAEHAPGLRAGFRIGVALAAKLALVHFAMEGELFLDIGIKRARPPQHSVDE